MSKSHVGMGFTLCPVCGKKHDEVVLIDKHLRQSLARDNFMGWGLCPEHEALSKEYVALIEVTNDEPPTLETADRTGRYVHVKREAWPHIFNSEAPAIPFGFINVEGFEKLVKLNERHAERGEHEPAQ